MDFPKPPLCAEPYRVSKSSDYFVAVGSSNLFAASIFGGRDGAVGRLSVICVSTPSANIQGNYRSHKETKSLFNSKISF